MHFEKLNSATGRKAINTKLVIVGIIDFVKDWAKWYSRLISIILSRRRDEGQRIVGVGDGRSFQDFFAQIGTAVHLEQLLGDRGASRCRAEDLDLRMRAVGVALVIDEAIVPNKTGRRGHKKRHRMIRVGQHAHGTGIVDPCQNPTGIKHARRAVAAELVKFKIVAKRRIVFADRHIGLT